MREEYELKKMKVKRRGILPSLRGQSEKQAKVRITIALDEDIVEYFRSQANKPGALPYQTQINQALRAVMKAGLPIAEEAEALKTALIKDKAFIRAVAEQTKRTTRR